MQSFESQPILLVTGLSGAGKSIALRALEDLGWEVVDNLPLSLLDRLLDMPTPAAHDDQPGDARPIALGIDSRTRGFDAQGIVDRIKDLRDNRSVDIGTLFLDCSGQEIQRRYSETRRRHPLALDRPAPDGIKRERELLAPLRRWADHVVDTTSLSSNDLQAEIRKRFERGTISEAAINVMSFGFARGVPVNADYVFDMRFLRNPHWVNELRELTGHDRAVAEYIAGDKGYEPALSGIESLLDTLLGFFEGSGKSYITIAFGCTGGRHRSVHCADRVAEYLRQRGFSPTVQDRDLPHSTAQGAENSDPRHLLHAD